MSRVALPEYSASAHSPNEKVGVSFLAFYFDHKLVQ